jgi:xylose isomerase
MSAEPFFSDVDTIQYEGPASDNPLAFRWYDANRKVLGKTMADHLRFGVCYWHSFAWDGSDIFGSGTLDRPWNPSARTGDAAMDPLAAAKLKMAAAFEFISKLGAPFFSFHDVDIAPAGNSFAETCRAFDEMVDEAADHMERTGIQLLWGTTNAFSHPRFMSGAATNPDPDMFTYAAAQVAHCMNATKQLNGANYVLWGGREGYETLLNTDLSRELDQLGRFMNMVVEHKYAIGFEGTLLIEPKPMEPTKHQYDYDVATVHAFLQKYGLADEIKVNIEVNHATLSGHDFHHEIATAVNAGIFGSVDANAGDDRLGWDLDLFPKSVEQMTLGMLEILRGGGLTTGGLMFDTKLRRQSIARDDLFHGHIGAMDTMARSLLAAASIIEEGELERRRTERYAGWDAEQRILDAARDDAVSLQQLHDTVLADETFDPQPASGRQEALEHLVARHIERTH